MSEYEGGTFRCTICAKEFILKDEADRHLYQGYILGRFVAEIKGEMEAPPHLPSLSVIAETVNMVRKNKRTS